MPGQGRVGKCQRHASLITWTAKKRKDGATLSGNGVRRSLKTGRPPRFQRGEQNDSKRKSLSTGLKRSWLALERCPGCYKGAGYYLNELTVPVRALMKEGYEITFANPKGNTPQVDVHSEVADFFGGDAAKLQDYMLFRDGLTGLRDPTRIADVIASGLDQYDAVFVPGGHGPIDRSSR